MSQQVPTQESFGVGYISGMKSCRPPRRFAYHIPALHSMFLHGGHSNTTQPWPTVLNVRQIYGYLRTGTLL